MGIKSTSRYCGLDQPDTSRTTQFSRGNRVPGAGLVLELDDIVNLYLVRQVCNIINADKLTSSGKILSALHKSSYEPK